jgi:glycosyltransferase involved in cell wall biosynthesis
MDNFKLPKISIVTPCFNQGRLLENTINSILSQNYPNLEYIIIDGASSDGSVDIIKKYAHKLTYWISEPDKGRGDAINKGFKHATGDIMAWLGCGDKYCPWALKVVSQIFSQLPEVEWLTTGSPISWDIKGLPTVCCFSYGYSQLAFMEGYYFPAIETLQQESTFWRRSLWERGGGYVDPELPLVPDFELWARFFKYSEIFTTSVPLGGICTHPGQEEGLYDYFSVGKSIWSKYYRNDRIPLLLRRLFSPFKKDRMKIVEYNFEKEQWQTKQIYTKVFPMIIE